MFIFQKDNKGFQTWTVTDAVWEESRLSFLTTLLGLSLMTQWLGIHLKAGVTGNAGLIPEVRRSSGGGNGNPLQNTCQNSPKDREDWWATVPGVTKSQTWLTEHTCITLPPARSQQLREATKSAMHKEFPSWQKLQLWKTENWYYAPYEK